MSKDILFNEEARNKVKKGLDTVVQAVGGTIGPCGRNVFIDDQVSPKITNDGVSIAAQITLEDKFENMGAWLAKNAAAQTNDDAGDGTTTTTVLLGSIVDESLARPENPTLVMRSLMEAKQKVLKELKKLARPITDKEILSVARISAEDETLAKLIAEVVGKVGSKSVVTVEDRKDGFETDYQIVQGYEANVGFASPYFRNDPQKARAVHTDIPVLCTAKKLGSIQDLKMFETFDQQNITSMVVVAEEIEPQVLGIFVQTKLVGKMNLLVIRATGPLLEDIAAATGATLIGDDTGVTFTNFDPKKHLGKAKKVVCEEKKTVFLSNAASARVQADRLEMMAAGNPNMFEQKKYRERASKLRGGIAVIRIGSHTDSERNYLKDKAEDAVHAVQSALEEGVVPGGGMAFYRIASDMKPKTVGEEILKKALTAPLRTIIQNAGKDYAEIIKNLPEGEGYDAKNDTYADFLKAGILDPVKVERCALENACSTAALFHTSHAAITDHIEPKD